MVRYTKDNTYMQNLLTSIHLQQKDAGSCVIQDVAKAVES
jgi:hypothetical protein